MSIVATCSCGSKFKVKDALAGKRVKCPTCAHPLTVPPASRDAARRISATCNCGKKLRVKLELAGKRVKCPVCANPLTIPHPPFDDAQSSDPIRLANTGGNPLGSSDTPIAKPFSASSTDLLGSGNFPTELLDAVPIPSSATNTDCPNCNAPMSAEAVLCVACGYHTTTGQQVPTTTDDKPEERNSAWSLEVESWSRFLIPGVVAVFLFGLLALVGLCIPSFGYFLALVLLVIGGLGGIVGYFWLLLIAYDEDVFCALLMFFLPFYSLYYLVTRWENSLPFWLFGAAVVANVLLFPYQFLLELLWISS